MFDEVLQNQKEKLVGKRVRLIEMNDPRPIESGTEGTILNIGFDVYTVEWDNGRILGIIEGEDKFEILED